MPRLPLKVGPWQVSAADLWGSAFETSGLGLSPSSPATFPGARHIKLILPLPRTKDNSNSKLGTKYWRKQTGLPEPVTMTGTPAAIASPSCQRWAAFPHLSVPGWPCTDQRLGTRPLLEQSLVNWGMLSLFQNVLLYLNCLPTPGPQCTAMIRSCKLRAVGSALSPLWILLTVHLPCTLV